LKIADINIGVKPVILAPMEDITDPPFRKICKKYKADLVFTEFISSEGLIRDAEKSRQKLDFEEKERPVGIQIFGHDVDSMRKAAEMASEANPDIIDINFGCPVKKVVSKGAGAALLKDIDKMIAISKAVVESTSIPVTAKTRLGWEENDKPIVSVAERLQDAGIQALTIHGRTRSQLYGGKADWSLIYDVKNNPRMKIPIIGNGDVTSEILASDMFEKYGVDGVMIGRGAIGNPWLFKHCREYIDNGKIPDIIPILERVETCREHIKLSVAWKGERRGINEMRKHYSGYFRGVINFKPFKKQLITAPSYEELMKILDSVLLTYS
jgi:nifR3 family TIM-barrel protein